MTCIEPSAAALVSKKETDMTKQEAIENHRKMWEWIAEETQKQRRCVSKAEYQISCGGLLLLPILDGLSGRSFGVCGLPY